MKQITENALLYRVNQLKEKMAMFEGGAMGQGSQGLTPAEIEKNVEIRHKAEADAQKTAANTQTNAQANQPVPGYKPYVAPAGTDAKATTSTQPQMSPAQTQGIPGGVVDQAIATQPATTTPAKPTTNAPPLSQLANPTAAPVAPGTAPKPGASAPAGKWPTTHDEIVAFQNANKLNPDGLIGEKTMAALKAQGIQAPAGFKPVANRQHPAAAKPGQKAAAAAQKAAPGTAGYVNPDGTVSSGNAQTDANLAANAAYVNLPSDEQHAINMYHGQQSQKTAASQQAVAQGQANLTSSDPITKAVANAAQNTPLGVNAVPPSSSPGTPSTGGFMQPAFASQQQQPPSQPSSEWDQNDPDTPAMFRNPLPGEPGMHESVLFKNEDSLARILQLAKW